MCGHERFGSRRGLIQRHSVRNPYRFALVHTQILGVSSPADDTHHRVAGLPHRRARTNGIDLATVLEPADVSRCARGNGVASLSLQDVRAVEPRSQDAHAYFADARLGRWTLLHFEHFRATRASNYDRFHSVVNLFGETISDGKKERPAISRPFRTNVLCLPFMFFAPTHNGQHNNGKLRTRKASRGATSAYSRSHPKPQPARDSAREWAPRSWQRRRRR